MAAVWHPMSTEALEAAEANQLDGELSPSRSWEAFMERIVALLDGPPRTAAIRIAALKCIAGDSNDPKMKLKVSKVAAEIGCSRSTLYDAIKAAERKLLREASRTKPQR